MHKGVTLSPLFHQESSDNAQQGDMSRSLCRWATNSVGSCEVLSARSCARGTAHEQYPVLMLGVWLSGWRNPDLAVVSPGVGSRQIWDSTCQGGNQTDRGRIVN